MIFPPIHAPVDVVHTPLDEKVDKYPVRVYGEQLKITDTFELYTAHGTTKNVYGKMSYFVDVLV